jgi:hypothetical protein
MRKALVGQGQPGDLRLASVIPPIRQASIRTLRESLDPTRCMLGFGQFGRCSRHAIRLAHVAQALKRSRPHWAFGYGSLIRSGGNFHLRARRHRQLSQRLGGGAGYPEPVKEHGQFPGDRHDGGASSRSFLASLRLRMVVTPGGSAVLSPNYWRSE